MERARGERELLDGPLDRALLEGNLRDMSRANRWLGGCRLSWHALSHVARSVPSGRRLRLLDVGTGAGDIPLFLLRRARTAGLALEVEATDIRPEIVDYARRLAGDTPDLHIALADGDGIDHGDASFDVVHASLLLHHLDEPAAEALLAEMARVCRRAVIVNDLLRARRVWLGAWLLARLVTGNPYTRHDAPLSVRRSYLPAEVEAMAARGGMEVEARFNDRLDHRYALVLRPRARRHLTR